MTDSGVHEKNLILFTEILFCSTSFLNSSLEMQTITLLNLEKEPHRILRDIGLNVTG